MVQRRALLIGVNDYDNFSSLRCAVVDAKRLSDVLARNDDNSLNYTTRCITSLPTGQKITRALVRQLWIELFENFDGELLFYYSGHGTQTPWGGYLVTQDGTEAELGVSMEDLLLLANKSAAREIVIILDCCHAGSAGNPPIIQALQRPLSLLREGVTVLAASRPNEVAYEMNGSGLFTDAIVEGLLGGAADHMGIVNAASLYTYADRLFGAWDQRPIYKSHTASVPTLRSCIPPVASEVLRTITTYFSTPDAEIQLDPEYESEPSASEENPARSKKREDARVFKRLRDARLLEAKDGKDLYWTAMDSSVIRLTNLGKYYWRLLDQKKI